MINIIPNQIFLSTRIKLRNISLLIVLFKSTKYLVPTVGICICIT